jgi:hypothetical protein
MPVVMLHTVTHSAPEIRWKMQNSEPTVKDSIVSKNLREL